jgi:peptide deformylase
MAVRPVLLYPDPRLKTPCAPVGEIDELACAAACDLWDTMNAGPPRTVGIAAPQIGAMQRIIVVDTSRNPKYPDGHGLLVLVNPSIAASEGEQLFREGCLSLPDYTANILRRRRVTVQAQQLDGSAVKIEADGFEAVVLQHEIDHIDGILFLDRVANVKTDLFQRKSGQ